MIPGQKFGDIVFLNPEADLFIVIQGGSVKLKTSNPVEACIYIAGCFESKIINHLMPLIRAEGYDVLGQKNNALSADAQEGKEIK